MKMKLFVLALLVLLSAGPAYPQSKEILQLQRDMIDVQQRVNQVQKTIDQNDAAMKSLVEKMADQVNTLAGAIQKVNQAVDVLKQQDDATGHDVRTALTGLNGTLKDLQDGMASIQTQMGSVSRSITTMKTTSEPLAGPTDLWKSAYLDYTVGNWDLAISDFQEFLSKYPNDMHAAEAHLLTGECYVALKKYEPAITEYDFVLQKFPESDTSKAALLKKGLAQADSNQPQAKETLNDVVKKFPGTSEASTAQSRLKELQKPAGRPPAR